MFTNHILSENITIEVTDGHALDILLGNIYKYLEIIYI